MRHLCPIIILILLAAGLSAHADTTYHLYTKDGSQTSASVMRGETVDLWVRMVTTDSVRFVAYDTLLDENDWQLTARNYGVYGWYADDDWDACIPDNTGYAYPLTVNDSLYSITPTDPDFHTDTSRADQNPVTGTWTIEDFTLQIPLTAPLGSHSISLQNSGAWDWEGGEFVFGVGDDFILQVTDIPEPATVALFAIGLVGLAARLRRRS